MKRRGFFIVLFSIIYSVTCLVSGQDEEELSLPQFLYPDFSEGTILLKNGQKRNMPMNYNLLTEKMVFHQNGKPYDLAGIETIDTVFIQKTCFIPMGNIFYEVAVNNKATLLIQHRGSLIPPGKPAPYGGVSHTSSTTSYSSINTAGGTYNLKMPSDFSVNYHPVYLLRIDYEIHTFTKQSQFLKIFPGKENELKTFIKANKIKFDKKENLVKLIEYCNSLI